MRNIQTMAKRPIEVDSDSGRITRFTELFSQLKTRLSKIAGSNGHLTFYDLVETAGAKSAAVREVKSELCRYERLAEAIGLDGDGHRSVLAVPTKESIAQLENLIHKLDPLQVGKVFAKPITVFNDKQSLHAVLAHMYENRFSQVVVETERGHVLLSSEGVARWLGWQSKKKSSLFEEVRVSDVLKFEPPETFTLARPNMPVTEAQRAFDERLSKHQPELRAVVITEDGSPKGKPVGLITPWDLSYMFSKQGDAWRAGDSITSHV